MLTELLRKDTNKSVQVKITACSLIHFPNNDNNK